MDLIAELASKVGLPADKAQALAGGVLGQVQSALSGKFGEQPAQELEQNVPELSQWKAQAAAATSGGGGLSGLLGGAGGLMGALSGGGGGLASLVGLLGQLGIDGNKASALVPIVLSFLQSRLSPELLSKITQAVPFLTGSQPDGGGGPGGLLKGLFG